MSALAIVHEYRYPFASALVKKQSRPTLRLATDLVQQAHPLFFQGQLREAVKAADALWCLGQIVQSRYHIPPAMLEKILILSDPVVTCDGRQLRWEVFSSCCSMYARVDLLETALDGDMPQKGTTNVDFQFAMRSALIQVRSGERVGLEVGVDGVTLQQGKQTVHERKVKLPVRWLKGFAEVQQFQSGMREIAKTDAVGAKQFLRGLPKGASSTPAWLVATPRGFRLAGAAVPGSLRLQGLARLRALEPLIPHLQTLRVYSDDQLQHSSWVADCGSLRFTLTLSAEVWRGFSGEGQLLHQLAKLKHAGVPPRLKTSLRWNGKLDPAELARQHDVSVVAMKPGLAALGSRGLVGFDQFQSVFFHRELPFDMGLVETMHPRLKKAKALLEQHPFTVEKLTDDSHEAYVHGSGGVKHRVRRKDDESKCTCAWFSKHGQSRGPCAHVLAVALVMESSQSSKR